MTSKITLIHLFKAAIGDFTRNKVRTALTSLGIMIGVMSVVLLIALGLGLKNYIQDQFNSMGANLVMVMPGSGFSSEGNFGQGLVGGVSFDERDLNTISRISEFDYVVPIFMKGMSVESVKEKKYAGIMGINEEGFKLMNIKAEFGKLFGKSEVQSGAKIAVLGSTLTSDLFESGENAVGKTVRIENQRYKVIGVAEKKGDRDMDGALFVPYKTTYGSINPEKTFYALYMGVKSEDMVEIAKKKAEEALLKRYKKDDFSVTEQSELLSTVNQIFGIINSVLIAIGSISLLVGGIGIMNIMYATVTERTKEVGIRRAVGATKKDILIQFLSESMILSVFGGLMGLLVSVIIVLIVRFFFPASINLLSVIITLIISSGIGVFFGVFPAKRAANLSPIEAIRYE